MIFFLISSLLALLSTRTLFSFARDVEEPCLPNRFAIIAIFLLAIYSMAMMALFKKYGLGPEFIAKFLFILMLVMLSLMDVFTGYVSHFWLLAFFLLALITTGHLYWLSLIILGSLFLLSWFLKRTFQKTEMLGGGDMLLAAALGGYFPWPVMVQVLFWAAVLGIFLAVLGTKHRHRGLPFVPCLSTAAIYFYLF